MRCSCFYLVERSLELKKADLRTVVWFSSLTRFASSSLELKKADLRTPELFGMRVVNVSDNPIWQSAVEQAQSDLAVGGGQSDLAVGGVSDNPIWQSICAAADDSKDQIPDDSLKYSTSGSDESG